ncbi:MAG TPA: diguanylate cyclase [Candidatus Sulfotelmatobacter sp.]|nr:diguanylate cyclase [Candidatus Sulfotelmatobacter sp.]
MSNVAQNDLRPDLATFHRDAIASHRRRPIRVLFMHHDTAVVNDCLHELKKAQFIVTADIVLTLEECTEQFRSHSYDVVVAGYPSPGWKGAEAVQLLHQTLQETPLLFVTSGLESEFLAELTSRAAFHYVEREHLRQLPLAVRQILNEQKLRQELESARKALRHSQSLYRALVDNPAYGIYRCNAEGKIVDANQTLVAMLGYSTKEELLVESHLTDLLSFLDRASPWAECSRKALQIEPVETQWKRKNGTMLKARISGRAVFDDYGNFAGHEIIAVDITEQRTLEDQLRHQASTDSLTGLANHRRLFEVLHAEICRSKRTGREFSLALLDLDGLKRINDSFSHQTGDRALCRLGQILGDCCRSVDTAARHGGDEFALVLPETGITAATLLAQRICKLLEREDEEPALSVSVGIASYPKDADTIGTLLYAADKALYAVKPKRPTSAQPELSSIHYVYDSKRTEFHG